MASIINASSSGSGGIVQTADASGVLQLQSNGTVALTVGTGGTISVGTSNVGGTLVTATTSGNWGEIIYDVANNASMLQFRNNAGAAAGNISLSSAGATSLLISSVAGVNFPVTQVASANANTLDDYEEGSFTPSFSATFGSITYNAQTGYYTKVGRLISVSFYMSVNTVVSGSGNLAIGLPFSATSTTPVGQNMFAGNLGLNSSQPTYNNLAFYSASSIAFCYDAVGGVMNGSQVTNGSVYAGTIVYMTD